MKKIKLRNYHGASWDEPLIMELGNKGERGIIPPLTDVKIAEAVGDVAALIPRNMLRTSAPKLPELSQYHVLQHFLRLSQETMGMDLGSDIGEGTCTMKYSPKMHEIVLRSDKFSEVHPLQPENHL